MLNKDLKDAIGRYIVKISDLALEELREEAQRYFPDAVIDRETQADLLGRALVGRYGLKTMELFFGWV